MRKSRAILILVALLSSITLLAQDVPALIKEGDRQESNLNEKGAYEVFRVVVHHDPRNVYALNKCSELCSRIGKREKLAKSRNYYYDAAVNYAKASLQINPLHAEANCVMAIALGRISLDKSGKEKINAAKEIKKHVDIAIKSDPQNYKAWHVLGRWHFELSNLNFIERGAVRVLFGGLPKSSIQESIAAFEKAKSISSGFLLNYYEMAKAYYKAGQKSKAIQAINTMLQLPNHTEDDEATKADGRKLLKDWK